jgi:hypothetical protein
MSTITDRCPHCGGGLQTPAERESICCADCDGTLLTLLENRFWNHVDRSDPDGCWPWRASTLPKGYGRVFWKGRNHNAHRVAWMIVNGDIPQGMFVCHRCDNPACCNPAHLFLGTPQDNVDDCVKKGRDRRGIHPGESNPHAKLTNEQVYEIRRLFRTMPHTELAQRYGVTSTNIQDIGNRKSWRHLPEWSES